MSFDIYFDDEYLEEEVNELLLYALGIILTAAGGRIMLPAQAPAASDKDVIRAVSDDEGNLELILETDETMENEPTVKETVRRFLDTLKT